MGDRESGLWQKAESIALLLGTCLLAFVSRDLSWVPAAGPQGQERLLHLFVYKYERPFPEHLDYHAVLTGFGVTASLLAAFSVFGHCRAAAARGLCVTALLFCAFCLNVYMPQLADHWSFQRLAERYYEDRPSAEVPLVAWQMNWKGENFYTGNRVFVFAELDNERLLKWMSRNRGRKAYFVFEHHRYGRFKQLMEDRPIRELSSRKDSNKFVLVELEI
jgi:hypothetical protein